MNPSEQAEEHVVLKPLLRCFDLLDYDRLDGKPHVFKNEYWDIEKMQDKLKREYGHIIEGKYTGLVVIPSRFQYSKDVSIPIENLKAKIKEEREKPNFDKELIKKLEGVLHDFEGNTTEHKVYAALTRIWKDKRGLLLHSFKPEQFLSSLTDRAKKQRETNSDFEFSRLEQKLAEILGID